MDLEHFHQVLFTFYSFHPIQSIYSFVNEITLRWVHVYMKMDEQCFIKTQPCGLTFLITLFCAFNFMDHRFISMSTINRLSYYHYVHPITCGKDFVTKREKKYTWINKKISHSYLSYWVDETMHEEKQENPWFKVIKWCRIMVDHPIVTFKSRKFDLTTFNVNICIYYVRYIHKNTSIT